MIDPARDNASKPPLQRLDDWEDDLIRRYPTACSREDGNANTSLLQPQQTDGDTSGEHTFRNYEADTRPGVRDFYRLNHTHQTLEFARAKRQEFLPGKHRTMSVWEAMLFLNELVDDSDPDTDAPQIAHLMQTAESIRHDGHPRWFILTGLIHDLGKILCLFGEPQWAVVGDTFPLGCAFSDKIVLSEFFAENPDAHNAELQTLHGIYSHKCGMDNVVMSWGHDEYLYRVVRDYLPDEALYMIRYHSFYPAHREGQYQYLMNDRDLEMFEWVRKFNQYDLYTKTDELPDVEALNPYYKQLIAEFFPAKIDW